MLHAAHHGHRSGPGFGHQKAHLVQPDAVLAAAGAAQLQGTLDQLLIEPLGGVALGGNGRVDQVSDVKVAVAHVAHDVVHQALCFGFFRGRGHALGQMRDGHAGVGRHGSAAGFHLQTGKVSVVSRSPEPRAFFWCGRPPEAFAAELGGYLLHRFGLLIDAGRAAVKLHQQHWRFGQLELVVPVHGAHRVRVQQLAARDRYTHLDQLDGGAHSRIDARESAGRGRYRLGLWKQLQRDFGHHAQRAFAAHHQARQVVAGGRLAGARASANHLALRGHDRQAEHVLAHRSVAHGIRAAGAGGAHAADAGVSTRVDWKKQPGVANLVVELHARHAGLHRDRQVFGLDRDDCVHAAQVQADAALHRQQVAFQ